jgi:hypothetical protein
VNHNTVKSGRRWYQLRWWYVLVMIVLIPVAWYLQGQIRGERELARVLAAWDADGRWRWEQVMADRPAVADEENLALLITKMSGTYIDAVIYLNSDEPLFDCLETHPQHLLSGDAMTVLKRRRKDVEGFFALLPRFRQMTARARVTIQDKGDSLTSMVSIQEHRNVFNRLSDQFRLELMEGRENEAFTLLRDQLKVADSLISESNLNCYLVDVAIRNVIAQNVQHWLAMSVPSEADLERMQQTFTDADSPARWRKIIMGEAGSDYALLMRLKQDSSYFDKILNLYPSDNWWNDPLGWARAYLMSQQMRSPWQYATSMQWMLDAYHQADQPLLVQRRWFKVQSEKSKEDLKKGTLSLTSITAPSLDKVLQARMKMIARIRCVQIALAVERFRRVNQCWPSSQAELVGKFLPAVLLDPFDDQPIRYKLLPDGVVIYSVASVRPDDVSDDGGDVLTHDNENRDRPKDMGIRLWDVSKRRLPARQQQSATTKQR